MPLFGVNTIELMSIHDNGWIDARIQQLSRALAEIDSELNSAPADHVTKKFQLFKRQNDALSEITHLTSVRKLRIENSYKPMLKHLDNKHQESKKQFSNYQKELEKKLKDAVNLKHINEHHVANIKNEHKESLAKLNEYHENIKKLKKDIELFRGTMKEGARKQMRAAKIIYYTS